ncbi:MAG TPA: prephenate dehydratase domain-containing protein [Bacillota bacterium]
MKIATLGPRGTYSEQATLLFAKRLNLGPEELEIIYTTVSNSLRLVQNFQADYAVVPVENMIDGLIGSTLDALIEYQDFVKVCDEIHLPIAHVLAANPNTDWRRLERIYSHHSPLNQCQNRLEALFPGIALIPVASTAEAAKIVLEDQLQQTAAICCPAHAAKHGLITYTENIQDYEFNETRFLVCSLQDGRPSGNDRTMLAVHYGVNQPGQLFLTTKYLADHRIDLTFVQSRPYKIRPQEYILVFEFTGHKSNPNVEAALKEIESQIRANNGWKKILGSYPKREREMPNVTTI